MAESPGESTSSSSRSLLWMMAALFGCVGILVGGGIFLASRVIRSLQVRESGDKTTVHTPAGDLRVEKSQDVGLGMGVYPRASLVMPGEGGPIQPPADTRLEIRSASYHTDDRREGVDDWYLKHLGPEFVRHGPGENSSPDTYRDAKISGNDIAFIADRNGQMRIVALEEEDAGTKIRIVYLGKRESQ